MVRSWLSQGGDPAARADKARAAAAAEGLELVPSSSNESGFKGVMKHEGKYKVSIREKGKRHYLGCFATPEEGALCYARHIGAERAAAEAAEARGERQRPLTPDEARAAAAAEGLELVPSSSNETGFKGVKKTPRDKYKVSISEKGKKRHLGCFATPEEGALCYARHIGAKRAAAEAAEARGEGLAKGIGPSRRTRPGRPPSPKASSWYLRRATSRASRA